jgi:hypothetical protein
MGELHAIAIDPIVIGFAAQNLVAGGPRKHAQPLLFLFQRMPVWFVFAGGHGMQSVL